MTTSAAKGPLRVEVNRRPGDPRRLAQKHAFALIGLDEMDLSAAENGEDEARQPCPAADIEQHAGFRREEREELRRIENVTAPDIAERARADKIDAPVPGGEQFDISLEPRHCFT